MHPAQHGPNNLRRRDKFFEEGKAVFTCDCFDNGAFKMCDEGEVPERTKVVRCVL